MTPRKLVILEGPDGGGKSRLAATLTEALGARLVHCGPFPRVTTHLAHLYVEAMLPALLGQTQTNQHAYLYWEFHERGFQQAVRMGDWKTVRPQANAPLELYDLKNDLGEKTNVAAQHPDVVAKIQEYFKTARTDSDQWPIKPAPQK